MRDLESHNTSLRAFVAEMSTAYGQAAACLLDIESQVAELRGFDLPPATPLGTADAPATIVAVATRALESYRYIHAALAAERRERLALARTFVGMDAIEVVEPTLHIAVPLESLKLD